MSTGRFRALSLTLETALTRPPPDGPEDAPLFRDPRYVRIWTIGCLTGVVRWLELLVYGIFAFEVTGSPSLVAAVALARFAPMLLFGVFIGSAADALPARRLMIVSLVGVAALAVVMLAIRLSGDLDYWHIVAAAFLSGAYWGSDNPVRRKLIGEVAGPLRLTRAMAFDNATNNGTRMLGPLVGGLLYQQIGLTGVFVLAAVLYALSILIAISLDAAAEAPARAGFRPGRAISDAAEALGVAVRNPDVARILAVTIIFNIWGFPFVSMIPVIGKEDLGLSPSEVGYLAALEGCFALMAAIYVGRNAAARQYRRLYFFAVSGVLCLIFMMGVAPSLPVIAIGLAACGLCMGAFAVMQSTLTYSVAPVGMRGRFLGLISICIGGGLIGFANIGLTAEIFGAANAMWIVALEGAPMMLLVGWRWRLLWRPD